MKTQITNETEQTPEDEIEKAINLLVMLICTMEEIRYEEDTMAEVQREEYTEMYVSSAIYPSNETIEKIQRKEGMIK